VDLCNDNIPTHLPNLPYLPAYLLTYLTYLHTYLISLRSTASQRGREAAAERAEAEKILQVKAAEAEGESKYLRGVGVAKERQAIVEGLR
jgi:hypothetical protein